MLLRFRYILDFFLYGHFFIAFCAVAMVFQTNYLRHFEVAGSNVVNFIFCATFTFYNLHKYLSLYLKKELSENPRYILFKRYDIPLSILTFIGAMMSFETFMSLRMDIKKLIIYFSIAAFLYILPIFKGKRLRDFLYIKNILLASVWASIVVGLPAIALGRDWWITDTFVFIEKCAFIFALSIPFDIRDRAWDEKLGTQTIPLSMGVEKAKKVAYIALLVSFLTACILLYMQNYSTFTVAKITFSLIISYFIIQKAKEDAPPYYYYLIDGMMLLQSAIVIFL